MTYAIIGSGNIGSAIASQFTRHGTPVAIANSSGPASIAKLAEELGPLVTPTELTMALQADVVIMAVPYEAAIDLVGTITHWGGRIIVDASNALDYSDFSPLNLCGRASTGVIAEAANGASLVKAFNHDFAAILRTDPSDGHGGRRVLFLSGDVPAANGQIASLMSEMGFRPVDLGRLDEGGLLQQFGGPLTSLDLVSRAHD